MTAWRRDHLTLIESSDQVVALAPVTTSTPQLVAAVVTAATQWASEAEIAASLMGWGPSEGSDLGQATLRLLDAVHTLEAQSARPPAG